MRPNNTSHTRGGPAHVSLYHLSRYGRAQGLRDDRRPAGWRADSDAEGSAAQRSPERPARSAPACGRGRTPRLLRSEWRGLRAPARLHGVGRVVRRDRALAHPEAPRGPAQARQVRRRATRPALPGGGTHRGPHPERSGGTGARRRALPRDLPARAHEVARHYVLKFLARRGLVYRDGKAWGQAHIEWLRRLGAPDSSLAAEDRLVLGEYLALLEYKLQRREELDRQIAALALTPALATAVGWLQCFRGIQLHTAMVLATEIVDWGRFADPRELMAYLGLVPTERSTGRRERKGALTKAGNTHCRHVLVQAAWSYHFRPKLSAALKARQQGQPVAVVVHAWKAQRRLHQRYTHLAYRK